MAKTRQEARENVRVLALVPWQNRSEWESYAKQELRAHPDWRDHWWSENLKALDTAGRVFDAYERGVPLDGHLDHEWQRYLDGVRQTHQAAGPGAGTGYKAVVSIDPRQPALFRRVAQVIGRLEEAIRAQAIGSRYRKCGVCGQVYQLQRPLREGDYACSDECREDCRQSDRERKSRAPPLPQHMVSGLDWHKTATTTQPTAGIKQLTEHIDSSRDAADDDDKVKGSPTD